MFRWLFWLKTSWGEPITYNWPGNNKMNINKSNIFHLILSFRIMYGEHTLRDGLVKNRLERLKFTARIFMVRNGGMHIYHFTRFLRERWQSETGENALQNLCFRIYEKFLKISRKVLYKIESERLCRLIKVYKRHYIDFSWELHDEKGNDFKAKLVQVTKHRWLTLPLNRSRNQIVKLLPPSCSGRNLAESWLPTKLYYVKHIIIQ